MIYGITGVELKIDLSRDSVEKCEIDMEDFQKYLGGKGINSKRAWQFLTPELDVYGEENQLIPVSISNVLSQLITGPVIPGPPDQSV